MSTSKPKIFHSPSTGVSISRPRSVTSRVLPPSVTSNAKSTAALTPTASRPGAKVEMLAWSRVATTSSASSNPAPVIFSMSAARASAPRRW